MSASVGTIEPRSRLVAVARPISASVVAGALSGLVIGGVGGRIAMLILRLTSDSTLHGLETDDGFTIGIVSTASFFLLIFTTLLGMVGGLVYLATRRWLPERSRAWLFAGLTGVVGATLIIRPGGIDFTRLDPLALAVAMFVAIPAAYGVTTSRLTERFLRSPTAFRGRWSTIAGLVPIALLGPFGLAIAALIVGAIVVANAAGERLRSFWVSPLVTWAGRALLVGIAIVASVALASDVSAVLDPPGAAVQHLQPFG